MPTPRQRPETRWVRDPPYTSTRGERMHRKTRLPHTAIWSVLLGLTLGGAVLGPSPAPRAADDPAVQPAAPAEPDPEQRVAQAQQPGGPATPAPQNPAAEAAKPQNPPPPPTVTPPSTPAVPVPVPVPAPIP